MPIQLTTLSLRPQILCRPTGFLTDFNRAVQAAYLDSVDGVGSLALWGCIGHSVMRCNSTEVPASNPMIAMCQQCGMPPWIGLQGSRHKQANAVPTVSLQICFHLCIYMYTAMSDLFCLISYCEARRRGS